MANGIEIETESLASDIQSMTQAVEELEGQTKEMYQLMEELDQMWDGPANEAFQAQFAADHEEMERFCRALREMIGEMEYARRAYEQCEEEVYEAVTAIQMEGGV